MLVGSTKTTVVKSAQLDPLGVTLPAGSTAPTQSAPGDNDTSIATTAFVVAAITAGSAAALTFLARVMWWQARTAKFVLRRTASRGQHEHQVLQQYFAQ